MDTEVVGVIESALMMPVAKTVRPDFFGDGDRALHG